MGRARARATVDRTDLKMQKYWFKMVGSTRMTHVVTLSKQCGSCPGKFVTACVRELHKPR